MSPLPPSIDETLGAAAIGFYVSCIVFGVFTTQVFTYFQKYPLDRLGYKILVACLWTLEFVDQCFIAYSLYFYSITHYNDSVLLFQGKILWSLILQITFAAMVGSIVKFCFAMRVWRFSKKNVYMTGVIILTIVAQFTLAIIYCIQAFRVNSLSHLSDIQITGSLALGGGVLTDIIVACALVYCLQGLRTGIRKADNLVNTLSIYAINTGALTGTVSLGTLILYNVRPDNFYFMAVYFTLGKLYAISFLCALNSRQVLRGKGTDREGNTSHMRNTFFLVTNNGRVPRTHGYSNHGEVQTKVDVHQEIPVLADVERRGHDKLVFDL